MRASAALEVFPFLQHCFTVDFVVPVIQVCVSCVCSVLGFLIQSLSLSVCKQDLETGVGIPRKRASVLFVIRNLKSVKCS